MGLFKIFTKHKKKKDTTEIPPSTWLPTPPPVYDYERTRPTKEAIKIFLKTNDLGKMAKILAGNNVISIPKDDNHNTFVDSLDHLDSDGDLPFGWTTHKQEFINPLETEFEQFRLNWVNSLNTNYDNEYSALKSFLIYINNCQKLCDSKGECYSFWCSEYLVGRKFKKRLEKDLKNLEEHKDEILRVERIKAEYLPNLSNTILEILKNEPGILQSDLWKKFDIAIKPNVLETIRQMESQNLIVKKKSGKSYALYLMST